ncbi:MAG: IclR family transcriptional regulator [Pseudomonadota bacterium]
MTDKTPPNLRTFEVLEVLGRTGTAMTATEINEHLGLPKQTVHRLCTTLETAGILEREGRTRRLRPARRARQLAAGVLAASNGQIARHQVLRRVAHEAGETVNLVIQQDAGMFYLDRVETDWPFRVQLPVGTNVPFHCTASGKTFMSSLPKTARENFVANLSLERHTANTIVEPGELSVQLAEIRRLGYALDDQEFFDGMVAIAVPVRDSAGRFLAALALHGPIQRFTLNHAISRRDLLLDAARRLGETMLA